MLIDSVAWLGHAGFRIEVDGATVYIDPYRVPEGAPPADAILVTHGRPRTSRRSPTTARG
jgi:L-ascorbate metabolism protein UlaG (beta-lactamase superfamily)